MQNSTISLLGDSTVRSIYCGLYRLLRGGENFLLTSNEAQTVGCGKIKAKRGVHNFDAHGLTIEYVSTATIADLRGVKTYFPIRKDKFTSGNGPLLEQLRSTIRFKKPLAILLHSAGWEYREIMLGNKLNKKIPNVIVDTIYSRNNRLMQEAMKDVFDVLSQENFNGRFIWRNPMCNTRYDSDSIANSAIDDLVRGAGHAVMDTFTLSRGRLDALWDGYHFDRPVEEPRNAITGRYAHSEEINALVTTLFLNMLFNFANC